jgi:hypothetical protein
MTKPPPVPHENRSPKGTGEDKSIMKNTSRAPEPDPNPEQRGQQGNITQNTRNQGYQQDR